MHKELQNGDTCVSSSLVSNYDHLYAMNDKSKTILVYGTANCIRPCLMWGLISHLSSALT